jgi:hypothetical protein
MFLLLFIDKYILMFDVSASFFDIGDAMNVKDCALGAVVAATIFAGACAETPAKSGSPRLAGTLFAERSASEVARGVATMRFCLTEVLDIAGEIAALAKQI